MLVSSFLILIESVSITIFNFQSGSWADGMANNLFNHKGFVKVLPLTNGQPLEQALDHAIDIGAEDVTGN